MELSRKQFIWFVIIPSITIIVLTFIGYCLDGKISPAFFYSPSEYEFHYDNLGQFGDFIGGFLGTVLTLIATIYVYQTYNSQKDELAYQKDELSVQKELVTQQQFETTFFNMLNVHRELKRDLSFESEKSITYLLRLRSSNNSLSSNIVIGQEVFKYANEDFSKFINQPELAIQTSTIKNRIGFYNISQKLVDELFDFSQESMSWNELEKIINAYNYIFDIYKNQISHYSRNVYHILKFIRENEKKENKGDYSKKKFRQYADIFQSQLTVEEQKLLFYNFLAFDDHDKKDQDLTTINLVNHYEFLENIGIENLVKKEHENLYGFVIKGSDRIL